LLEIPSKLPALQKRIRYPLAQLLSRWPEIGQIFEKLDEEVGELRAELADGDRERLEDELGDLLFVIVNIARVLKIDSESALKRANRKFKSRFQHMEAELAKEGKNIERHRSSRWNHVAEGEENE
jgi:uncharacterized protein YabN with tetrapyrrole methylase and pyrophosphatase domain